MEAEQAAALDRAGSVAVGRSRVGTLQLLTNRTKVTEKMERRALTEEEAAEAIRLQEVYKAKADEFEALATQCLELLRSLRKARSAYRAAEMACDRALKEGVLVFPGGSPGGVRKASYLSKTAVVRPVKAGVEVEWYCRGNWRSLESEPPGVWPHPKLAAWMEKKRRRMAQGEDNE